LADLMRLSLRERRTRGFVLCCVAGNAAETSACAAFIEESRMKHINATKLRRKSGVWGLEEVLFRP
jgi:hypothetical protein